MVLIIIVNFEHGLTSSYVEKDGHTDEFLLDQATKKMGADVDEIFVIYNNEIKKHYTLDNGWWQEKKR